MKKQTKKQDNPKYWRKRLTFWQKKIKQEDNNINRHMAAICEEKLRGLN